MTPQELSTLLAAAAVFDDRVKVDKLSMRMWWLAVGDLPFELAEGAVVWHYQRSEYQIRPKNVIERVAAVRRDRLERTPLPAPSAEAALEPGRYKAELDAMIASVTTGTQGQGLAPVGHPNRRRELNREYAARRALQAPAVQPPMALRAAQGDADGPDGPLEGRVLVPVPPARSAAAERAAAEAQRYLAARLGDPATQEYLERAHAELEAEDGEYDAVDVTVRAAALMQAAEPKVS